MFREKKCITVFGSSIPHPGDEEYELAYQLGKIIGNNGLNICTGGFQGVMDAASKGCIDAGGEALGITIDIYNAKPSAYLTEEFKCHTLFDRLKNLIEIGDAYIILQGGTGTLVELALVWEFMNKSMIDEKPIACHSSMWKSIVEIMEKQILKEKRKCGLVKYFDQIADCGDYIINSLK
jgi:uncharacterized protein (TIGR00730 family)